ncbi:uncharacterized protein LOC114957383 [Acropora millepora]|uniref:uncharacterized protein LOC114957383 n=1 Tax=Acropora millepora TaxID=45264 RepID=UPI0010FCAAF0|nr:uncharacterized protein LOC114957383 [Acropora millepora]
MDVERSRLFVYPSYNQRARYQETKRCPLTILAKSHEHQNDATFSWLVGLVDLRCIGMACQNIADNGSCENSVNSFVFRNPFCYSVTKTIGSMHNTRDSFQGHLSRGKKRIIHR